MSVLPVRLLSPEQHLEIERAAQVRSEFHGGEMFAMAGASRRHNLISGNAFASLHAQTKLRSCEAYQSEMRVKVSATGLDTYPDVVTTCDRPRFEDVQGDTLLNPQAIVDVLSKTTEAWDRGQKFSHYRQIASLREYLLISQVVCLIEKYSKRSDGRWLLWDSRDLSASVGLESIECVLPIAEIYAKVVFGEENAAQEGAKN